MRKNPKNDLRKQELMCNSFLQTQIDKFFEKQYSICIRYKENNMKTIPVEFKDDKDRMIMLAMFVLTIFCSFIPSLIVFFILKNNINESMYEGSKALFNFELLLFLISLLCLIPVIGWLASPILIPVLLIWNVIIVVINLCSMAKENIVKVPEYYKFI